MMCYGSDRIEKSSEHFERDPHRPPKNSITILRRRFLLERAMTTGPPVGRRAFPHLVRRCLLLRSQDSLLWGTFAASECAEGESKRFFAWETMFAFCVHVPEQFSKKGLPYIHTVPDSSAFLVLVWTTRTWISAHRGSASKTSWHARSSSLPLGPAYFWNICTLVNTPGKRKGDSGSPTTEREVSETFTTAIDLHGSCVAVLDGWWCLAGARDN